MIHMQTIGSITYYLKKGWFGGEKWILNHIRGSVEESYNAKKYRLDQCIAKFKEKYKI